MLLVRVRACGRAEKIGLQWLSVDAVAGVCTLKGESDQLGRRSHCRGSACRAEGHPGVCSVAERTARTRRRGQGSRLCEISA